MWHISGMPNVGVADRELSTLIASAAEEWYTVQMGKSVERSGISHGLLR